jgi:hypothetical protein
LLLCSVYYIFLNAKVAIIRLCLFLSRSATALVVLLIIVLAIAAYILLPNFLSNISNSKLPIPLVSIARNWAGYVVADNLLSPKSTVQSVSASWIVPSVNGSGTDTFSSVWVGIGGQFDHTLIQVGTEQDYAGGSARYYAWYELLPSNIVVLDEVQVSPGDQIEASISMVGSSNNSWSISLQDLTSNTSFHSNFVYDSQRLTAEWIVERPVVNGALAQLADFGSVTFTGCQANLSGKTGGITDFSYNYVILDPLVQNSRSIQLVSVSGSTGGGTEFTVDYVAL